MTVKLNVAEIEQSLSATPAEANVALSSAQREHDRRALDHARRRAAGQTLARAIEAVDSDRNLEGARLALQALEEDSESVPAYLAGAVALDRLGMLPAALSFYEQAVMRLPNDATIASLLGATALRVGNLAVAEGCYRIAAQLEPQEYSHVSNLAGILRDQGRFSDAIELLRAQIYLHPEQADLWNTLGTVLQEQGDPENALTFLAEAVRLRPDFARAYHNLGCTLTDLARFEDANAALDLALAHSRAAGDCIEMRHARAMARFGAGRIAEGWRDYEARLDPLLRDSIEFLVPKPRWRGEDLRGKRLLVLGEQGLGDEIMFLSAAPDALAALGPGGALTIACEARLQALIARSFPTARICGYATKRIGSRIFRAAPNLGECEDVDFWAPVGDLAAAFRKDAAAFAQARPFLKPDAARVAGFRADLAALGEGLKVGIAWKSLLMSPKRARFFAAFRDWAPVLRVPGVRFVSMQYGDTAEEEKLAREQFGVALNRFPDLDLKADLDGVAAAGAALDVLIAPMNATTNLAAACGANVWILQGVGSWTMFGTERTALYPEARAYRDPAGTWLTLMQAAADDLARSAGG